MKRIIYSHSGGVAVVTPVEGARLATAIRDAQGAIIAQSETPMPVDLFLRSWPVVGVTAEWAETEDEFVERIKQKDVPAECLASAVIMDASAIPSDRSKRAAWRLSGGAIVIDASAEKKLAIAKLDAQMLAVEREKVLGRTAREDMLARWVRDYIRAEHPEVEPLSVTSLDHSLAIEAFAAFADPQNPYYNKGVGRLKAANDAFVALRAERKALRQELGLE